MPTITSSGAVSGLNVNSLVPQLVAAERAPYEERLLRIDTKLTTELSSLSQLKGVMATFQGALANLKKPEDFSQRKVTLSDTDHFTATAASAAAAGSYDVEVVQLAKVAQLGSTAVILTADTVVGTGTLNITLGAKSFNITLTDGNDKLSNVRDAINAATDNPGVQATIIRDVNGAHLVLTGATTGAANTITVTASGGNGGLAQFDTSTPANYQVLSTAQDAIVNVQGYEIHDTDNIISDAVDGVTLTLKKQEPGTETSLTVALDNSGIQGKVNSFITAYNALATQIAKLQAYDPATKVAGPMLGDPLLRSVDSQLRRMLTDPVSGTSGDYTTLASLGITSNANGTLTLNVAKLDAALAKDSTAVSKVFASGNGAAVRMHAFIETKLSTSGDFTARDNGIKARRKDLDQQRTALDARMQLLEERYRKQFNALDSLLTQMQSTSSYLSQQLANLPGAAR
jgi:flagellar hook-associated protein 2